MGFNVFSPREGLYFDQEIRTMYTMEDMNIPNGCILNSLEFDIACLILDALSHIKHFTKIVQQRTKPMLCHLPSLIDNLVTALSPGLIENTKFFNIVF